MFDITLNDIVITEIGQLLFSTVDLRGLSDNTKLDIKIPKPDEETFDNAHK